MTDDADELQAGAREAEAFLLALRSWPTVGDELAAALARSALGTEARLRGFVSRIQTELHSTGRKENGREGRPKNESAKWTLHARRRAY